MVSHICSIESFEYKNWSSSQASVKRPTKRLETVMMARIFRFKLIRIRFEVVTVARSYWEESNLFCF